MGCGSEIRDGYLTAAESALELLRARAVAEAWEEPSALEGYSVGGLAAHLANQILQVPEVEPTAPGTPVPVLEHFTRAPWFGRDDTAREVNDAIRTAGEDAGRDGPAALVARTAAALEEVRARVDAAPDDLVVHLPRAGWDLTYDDFLLTRLMELAVHADDLAVSVRVPTPGLPEPALLAVTDLLSRLAVRRHGALPVLRALSRTERAPGSVSAF
ncbi:maleylpyruvate isomerase N-terminal domain-containing protein [Streptomyces sp. NPDC048172]|uniref:maleylpyruvate isomerase N-terminal domain-containing protein n=1 Tax=Streptomyces sp. NPDC048172 TaxID=3365505 RepID=UPI00371216DE